MSSRPAKLTAKQERFADEYLVDLNATQAAIRAGYSAKTAHVIGPENLGKPAVAALIAERQAERAKRTEITQDAVLRRLWVVATADPRELIEYRRTCCRYCHSINHEFHRTKAELDRDRATWEAGQKKSSKEEFNVAGGPGYNATFAPNADCPECFGEGVAREFVHDTRTLSAAALTLYAGISTTKGGVDVKMHDQQSALLSVGRHLGMFTEKPEASEDAEGRARRLRAELDAMDAATTGAAA